MLCDSSSKNPFSFFNFDYWQEVLLPMTNEMNIRMKHDYRMKTELHLFE